MSPRLQSVALRPWDQIWLCVTGAMKFAPPPMQVPASHTPEGRERLGLVKALAIQMLDENTTNNFHEVAHLNGINPASLKAAISRERCRRRDAKQVRGRVAA
jgi:hypothetical protein